MKLETFKKFINKETIVLSLILAGCLQMAEQPTMCGKLPYDPDVYFCNSSYTIMHKCANLEFNENQFCYQDSIYSKCKGKDYNPSAEFCSSGNVYNKCNEKNYNPSTEFCSNNNVYSKCGGEYNVVSFGCCGNTTYTLSTQRCNENNIIETKCGNEWFNNSNNNFRCNNGVIETKCGVGWYDATNSNLRCESGVIETKCGSGWYDATKSNLLCENDAVEAKCGNERYDATNSNLRCESGVIETKCGNGWYNATNSDLRCESGVIETKCSNKWYNASIQFCLNSEIYSLCGGVTTYDPATEQCCGSSKYTPATQFCDSRDSKAYKRVTIGKQVWMAENLNYNASGSKCYAEGVSGVSTDSITKNCEKYGRLYDWATAMSISSSYNTSSYDPSESTKYRGVCPDGWHLPNVEEWDVLRTEAGGSSIAGGKLKARSGWNGNGNGTDNYGFSALPGGIYSSWSSNFSAIGYDSYWWSATEFNASYAYYRYIYHSSAYAGGNSSEKKDLYSVRCVQD